MNKYLATILLGLIRLGFTVVSCIMMRRCGRRSLTFISSKKIIYYLNFIKSVQTILFNVVHQFYNVQWPTTKDLQKYLMKYTGTIKEGLQSGSASLLNKRRKKNKLIFFEELFLIIVKIIYIFNNFKTLLKLKFALNDVNTFL